MTVISLTDAKAHLNLADDSDDTLLTGQIAAAEAYVSRWLTVPLAEMTLVPADLRQAVLMLVGHWYENREATLVGISAEEVPFGVQNIIDQHRSWAF